MTDATRWGLRWLALAGLSLLVSPQMPALSLAFSWTFAPIGLAYLAQRPQWLGKGADGRRRWLSAFVFAPFLGFSWLVWRSFSRRQHPAWHVVAPNLWLGRRPDALPPECKRIVDLTAELPPAFPSHPSVIYMPVLDALAPPLTSFTALISRLEAEPRPTLVHCAQGHGRSALVVCALRLARGLSTSPEAAEADLRAVRPGVRLRPAQRACLRQWWQNHMAAAMGDDAPAGVR